MDLLPLSFLTEPLGTPRTDRRQRVPRLKRTRSTLTPSLTRIEFPSSSPSLDISHVVNRLIPVRESPYRRSKFHKSPEPRIQARKQGKKIDSKGKVPKLRLLGLEPKLRIASPVKPIYTVKLPNFRLVRRRPKSFRERQESSSVRKVTSIFNTNRHERSVSQEPISATPYFPGLLD